MIYVVTEVTNNDAHSPKGWNHQADDKSPNERIIPPDYKHKPIARFRGSGSGDRRRRAAIISSIDTRRLRPSLLN